MGIIIKSQIRLNISTAKLKRRFFNGEIRTAFSLGKDPGEEKETRKVKSSQWCQTDTQEEKKRSPSFEVQKKKQKKTESLTTARMMNGSVGNRIRFRRTDVDFFYEDANYS
jgi:hypothetical protein